MRHGATIPRIFLKATLIFTACLILPAFAEPAAARALPKPHPRIPIDPVSDFVIPLLYDGGGYLSSIFLTNRDSSVLHFGVYFFGPDGSPVALPVQGIGNTEAVALDLDVNQSATLQTTGQSAQFCGCLRARLHV